MGNQWEYDYSELYHSTQRNQSPPPQPPIDVAYTAPMGRDIPQFGAQTANVPPPMPPKQAGKKRGVFKRIVMAAAAVVTCAAVGFGGGYWGSVVANKANAPQIVLQQPAATEKNSNNTATASGLNVSQVATAVSPSVVEVTTERVTTNPLFGQYVTDGAGSGVILSEDGYIITNNHVVEGASQIRVRLHDKKEYVATLVGADAKTDIAVLKVDATGITAAKLGNSDSLSVGEFALAVGNPMGTLGGTVTDGIISALNREITVGTQSMMLLQTNAAVSPGNSGGGLFNGNGELIGIVNAKSSGGGTEGLGFAIPINTAVEVAQQLMDHGYVTNRPALGVTVVTVGNAQTAAQYGVSRLGVYVAKVDAGGAAEKSGLKVGDLFVSVGDVAIAQTNDLTTAVGAYKVGDTIQLQVVRENKILNIETVLQESARPAEKETQQQTPQQNANPFAGIPGFSGSFGE